MKAVIEQHGASTACLAMTFGVNDPLTCDKMLYQHRSRAIARTLSESSASHAQIKICKIPASAICRWG